MDFTCCICHDDLTQREINEVDYYECSAYGCGAKICATQCIAGLIQHRGWSHGPRSVFQCPYCDSLVPLDTPYEYLDAQILRRLALRGPPPLDPRGDGTREHPYILD